MQRYLSRDYVCDMVNQDRKKEISWLHQKRQFRMVSRGDILLLNNSAIQQMKSLVDEGGKKYIHSLLEDHQI